jgi:thiaminase/transcriptional activator TenA
MNYKWFPKTIDLVHPLMNQIKNHAFIKELSEGTLSAERFHFYMHQDAFYLTIYGKVLGNIATQLKDPDHSLDYMSFANGTIEVEKALHKEFISQLGGFKPPEKSPTCSLYTGFLTEVYQYDSIEVSLSAVLPCFWIYKEVGDYLLSIANTNNNPYQKWMDTYGGEDFSNSVDRAIEITEYYAQNTTSKVREEMTQAFLKTAQLEWMFWDSAYRKEKWPV